MAINASKNCLSSEKNTSAWMLPGGKLDGEDTASEALVRKLAEELQIEVDISALRFLGTFSAVTANEAAFSARFSSVV